jgi:hypothetical protein
VVTSSATKDANTAAKCTVLAKISDVRRVDGIYEILYVAYNAVAQEQDGMHLSTEKRNALVNEMHQLFEFAVLNLVCFSLSPTFLLPLLKLDRNAPPF